MDGLLFIGFIVFLLTLVAFLKQSESGHNKKRNSASDMSSSEVVHKPVGSEALTFKVTSDSGEEFTVAYKEAKSSGDPLEDDYQSWVSILSEKNPHLSEFQLYGTKAAVIWGEDGMEDVVQVVCITSFNKGVPVTKKYEYYQFDIVGWYWSYMAPKGSASEVKSYIKSLGLPRAKEKALA
jgi:hypothetical protein